MEGQIPNDLQELMGLNSHFCLLFVVVAKSSVVPLLLQPFLRSLSVTEGRRQPTVWGLENVLICSRSEIEEI